MNKRFPCEDSEVVIKGHVAWIWLRKVMTHNSKKSNDTSYQYRATIII